MTKKNKIVWHDSQGWHKVETHSQLYFDTLGPLAALKSRSEINKKRKISGQIINLQDEEAIELKQNKQTFLIPFNIISECNLDTNYL